MPDLEITCAKCSSVFIFTERDQNFYYQRNRIWPRHCESCRGTKKAKAAIENGNKTQRYEITCDQCGKPASVPFKPAEGRPILCRECYSAMRAKHAKMLQ